MSKITTHLIFGHIIHNVDQIVINNKKRQKSISLVMKEEKSKQNNGTMFKCMT